MPSNDKIDAKHLSDLCRIKISEEENKLLDKNLEKILAYMDQLTEVNTDDVPACTHVLETMTNVMEEDKPNPTGFDRNLFFENTPDHVGGMIKVPTIIQFEE